MEAWIDWWKTDCAGSSRGSAWASPNSAATLCSRTYSTMWRLKIGPAEGTPGGCG